MALRMARPRFESEKERDPEMSFVHISSSQGARPLLRNASLDPNESAGVAAKLRVMGLQQVMPTTDSSS